MQILSDYIQQELQNIPVLRYFNRMLYSDFMPDVNGYVLIFMIPPHLSGYNLNPSPGNFLGEASKLIPFVGIDASPPSSQVTVAEINGTFGGIPYGTKVSNANQINITYLDTADIQIFSMHKTWETYIRDVTIGQVKPDDSYMGGGGSALGYTYESDFCYIDYLASAYVLKFRPSTLGSDIEENIVYVGKAVGIFPLSLPHKELIGRRDANELTILPITYNSSIYREYVVTEGMTDHSERWVYDELTTLLSRYA